ncbi:uncharacterized protein FYW47_007165 [Aplochiton taeniatus]
MPPSFKGVYGKIVYMLEAKISRSWRMDRTVERELNFVSLAGVPNLASLMVTQQTVNSALKIPPDLCPSIQNCDIIFVEYELKVYLDISFATDPTVTFPLFIVPESCISGLLHSGAPSHSDFPASIPSGTYPPVAKPYKLPATVVNPAYPNNYPAQPLMYAAQPSSIGPGYQELPHQTSPYPSPPIFPSPSSTQECGPTHDYAPQ